MSHHLPLLVAASLAGCIQPDPDPCTLGFAVTEDGRAFNDLSEALGHALEAGGDVSVCPGEHELTGDVSVPIETESAFELVIRGAGESRPVLLPHPDGAAIGDFDGKLTLEHLEFASAPTVGEDESCSLEDEADESCESPYDAEGRPDGAVSLMGSVELVDVWVTDNRGYWGGALGAGMHHQRTSDIELVDCVVTDNTAIDGTQGGGLLLIHDGADTDSAGLTVTSVNTDWGEGETDNFPDDIAFAAVDLYDRERVVVLASYSFDGVADFTCESATNTCE